MKRFKNSLFFVSLVFLLVFSLGMVIAENHYTYQCSDDQVIFKISNTTNAHGEVFNGTGNYGTKICHDEIFGYDGVRGVSGETILWLSSLTNAHGEINEDISEGYSVEVFFGRVLECINRDVDFPGTGNFCEGDEDEVARMACKDSSNCMFGAPGSEYFANNTFYNNYAVCCISQSLENPLWQDMAGGDIGEEYVNLNDRVNMHVETPGFDGFVVDFKVWGKDDSGWHDVSDVVDADPGLNPLVSGGFVNVNFKITSDIIEAGNGWFDCSGGDMMLKFEVSESTTGLSTESEILNVYCDNEDNSNPVANITNPVNGEIYLAATYNDIEFEEESTDEDDYINSWKWEVIQNGNIIYERTLDRENGDLDGDHSAEEDITFSEGHATVKLTVTDERGLTSIDEITLVILEGDGGAGALIGLGNGDDFGLAVEDVVMWVSGGKVVFDGTDSYVISYDGSCTLTCEAGVCPDIDEIHIPTANCGGTVIIEDGGNLDFVGVLFEWDFNDAEIASASGTPLTEVIRYYHSLVSNDRKDKLSSLRISWSGGEVTLDGFGEKEFTLGQCINNGNTYLDVDYDSGVVTPYSTTTAAGKCNLAPYGDELGQCCPLGMYCSDSGTGVCLIIPSGVEICEDYTSETDCEEDEFNAAVNDPAGEGMVCLDDDAIPGEFQCIWNNAGEICELYLPCGDPGGACFTGGCSYSYTRTECGAEGYMEVTYIPGECQIEGLCDDSLNYCTNGDYENECQGGTETVPCGRLNFELGFFEYAHFLAATLIISLIYLSIYWRREEK